MQNSSDQYRSHSLITPPPPLTEHVRHLVDPIKDESNVKVSVKSPS